MLVHTLLNPKIENGALFFDADEKAKVRFYAVTDKILRLTVAFDGFFKERSYALATVAWDDELDELLKEERRRISPLPINLREDKQGFCFETKHLKAVISKDPAGLSLYDKTSGTLVYKDLKERAYEKDHLGRIFHYSSFDYEHDHVYGMGEISGHLDKKGRHLRLCPKDSIGLDAKDGMPLYKHIPFCIRVNETSNRAIGLFYNNSYDATFDWGNERSGYWDRYCYYSADGGQLDVFFIYGPSIAQVTQGYCFLTGTSAFLPKHALGYTSSTMYYAELEQDCDKEIFKVMAKHQKEQIFADNFWLASGYSSGEQDNLRYTFNWNKKRFPDPKGFFDKMASIGINVIPNLKPGVLTTHPYLDYYKRQNALIKTPDGKEDYLGRWWGGPGFFVDFTSQCGRAAWSKLLKENILSLGCTTVWNDNCEYDGIEDRNAQVSAEGTLGRMSEYKIIQSNMMAYTAKQALHETNPHRRPYIINRAGFAGIQRYAQVWGGDNLTSWRTLKYNVAMILGMGLSGVAHTGCDIGGFAGPAPEAELLLRWIQQGIFQPRFTINSANTDNTVTQPFMYPQILNEVRQAYALRCRLMPYWYSLCYEASLSGAPIVRPLCYEFQDDVKTLSDESLTFTLGKSLLVANVLEKGAKQRTLYLPKGADWYSVLENFKRYEGGQTVSIKVKEDSIPMFVRSEAVIPVSFDLKNLQSDKVKNLTWYIASAGRDLSFTYFDDDGVSDAYLKGDCIKTSVTVSGSKTLKIRFKEEGRVDHPVENLLFKVISPGCGALYVSLNGNKLPRFLTIDDFNDSSAGWYYDLQTRIINVKCQRPRLKEYELVVSTERFDLIGMENNGLK